MPGAPLQEASRAVRRELVEPPSVGVVLGSGLGAFADELSDLRKLPYSVIPHMPDTGVRGHQGNLCLGRWGGVEVACLQGRVHSYEGYGLEQVVFGVRLLAELGCQAVVLTNAAGGIADGLGPGQLMLIVDHMNLTGQNPLVGPPPSVGERFVDMTQAYDAALGKCARRAARELDIDLAEGVYAAMLGPSYETPAEIRMLRALGADAVGMSTVHEVIALRQLGVRVGALSTITNLGAGLSGTLLDHAEVERVASASRDRVTRLLGRWVELAYEEVSQ
jgi:purine-nucleoside phosphorylase